MKSKNPGIRSNVSLLVISLAMTNVHHVAPGWDLNQSPFHEGEREIQQRVGIGNKMEVAGRRGFRRYMPDQHREFFPQLPFVVAAAVDENNQPWASLLFNTPGFVQSPDPQHLSIDAAPDAMDPLHGLLKQNALIGLLGIQPHTRRRNRLNGRIISSDPSVHIEVQQSFGNCPKYIQARHCEYDASTQQPATRVISSTMLDAAMRAIISNSDMFFIASAHPDALSTSTRLDPTHGVDVSHRGGKAGFVRVENNSLTIPDYIGNFFFNTLGNLSINPRAGLLFIDFDNGTLLHLAVTAEIIWDEAIVTTVPGAQRLLRFTIKEARHVLRTLPLRWTGWELSPHLVDK